MELQNKKSSAILQILETVEYIWKQYQISCRDWTRIFEIDTKYNYKKSTVSDVDFNSDIYANILVYLLYVEVCCLIIQSDNPKFACRAKNKASVDSKVRRYNGEEKYKYGKVPINKCLNDIFGARIIIDYPFKFDEIDECLKNNFLHYDRLKITDSSKNEYKATHIYFKESNFFLPWELQIWFSEDEKTNRSCHKKYKQDYIRYEQALGKEENNE